jgi:hypothetical protein
MWRKCLMIGAMVLLALEAAGCPILLIPSLGYEGYEYHKTGTLPGMPPRPHGSPTPAAGQVE